VFAQVPEDALDGVRVGDGGDDAHAAVTAGAVECVDEKDPAQKLGPGELVPRGRLRSGRLSGRCRCRRRWNDHRPVAGRRREDAVEANGVLAWERDESLDELERCEHDRLGPSENGRLKRRATRPSASG